MTWTPLSFSSGQVLTAAELNNLQGNIEAVRDKHRSNAAPESPVAGTNWLDISNSPILWIWKVYDGTSWTEFAEIDTSVSETRIRNPMIVRQEGSEAIARLQSHSSSGSGGNIELRRSRGTAETPTLIQSGDIIGSVIFQGYNGSLFRSAAEFTARASEEWSTSGQGTELVFSTNANGEVGDATDRLKIKSNGQMELRMRLNMITDQSSSIANALLSVATFGSTYPGAASQIFMYRGRGSSGAPTAVNSGDGMGVIGYAGYDGTALSVVYQEKLTAAHNFSDTNREVRVDRQICPSDGGGDLFTYQTIFSDGGMVYGNPSGGSQGFGTINAVAFYEMGSLITCYPLEYARTGNIDLEKWDSLVPQHSAITKEKAEIVKDKDGAETTKTTKEEVLSPVRTNEKARAFLKNADMLLDPEAFTKFWQTNGHLPAFPSVNSWEQLSIGDISQRLWETVEVQAVHISKLTARINSLEARGIVIKAG